MDTSANGSEGYKIIPVFSLDDHPGYEGYIFAHFMHSLRKGNELFKLVDKDAFYENYHRFIQNLLQRPEIQIRFAVLSDDPDVVLGFSLLEKNVIHYVFVAPDFRKQGIGKDLSLILSERFNYMTHLTNDALLIWPKYPSLTFNPFL